MSYKKAIYYRDHPHYSEPTEYLTMEIDGLTVALHFHHVQDSPEANAKIENALMMAHDINFSEESA